MRLSIRAKQIAGVTAIVGFAVVALSALHVTRLATVLVHESRSRAEMLAQQVVHRAGQVPIDPASPHASLRADAGLQSILQSSVYGENILDAALVDVDGVIVAHSDARKVGTRHEGRGDLTTLDESGPLAKLRAVYTGEGQTLEVRRLLVLDDEAFGSVRVGASMVFMRNELTDSLSDALATAAAALLVGLFVAALLAQALLRPIHVIKSGLTRLGRGEFGVTLDLPPGDEFGDLGSFFNTISKQLSDGRAASSAPQDRERLLESTLAYSQKLVALGRLTAGIAHEVKNPLNAMMIHLELLRTKIRKGTGPPDAAMLEHVEVIEKEIRRLDEVVQGFLKFTRPEELRLAPVRVSALVGEILPIVQPEADSHGVRVIVDCQDATPPVNGDAPMLRQAFLNLAINACQAMPQGGTLRLTCAAAGNQVEVRIEDTGVGIPPEHLGRIFDLYFTTKDHGTGIGLSMVYRIVQLHDGEIEVQSTPGRGTTFTVRLPRASEA
jgi:signal transduction histidine kinase